jgi:hypothetical protein
LLRWRGHSCAIVLQGNSALNVSAGSGFSVALAFGVVDLRDGCGLCVRLGLGLSELVLLALRARGQDENGCYSGDLQHGAPPRSFSTSTISNFRWWPSPHFVQQVRHVETYEDARATHGFLLPDRFTSSRDCGLYGAPLGGDSMNILFSALMLFLATPAVAGWSMSALTEPMALPPPEAVSQITGGR